MDSNQITSVEYISSAPMEELRHLEFNLKYAEAYHIKVRDFQMAQTIREALMLVRKNIEFIRV